jgi:hypothetical protein
MSGERHYDHHDSPVFASSILFVVITVVESILLSCDSASTTGHDMVIRGLCCYNDNLSLTSRLDLCAHVPSAPGPSVRRGLDPHYDSIVQSRDTGDRASNRLASTSCCIVCIDTADMVFCL